MAAPDGLVAGAGAAGAPRGAAAAQVAPGASAKTALKGQTFHVYGFKDDALFRLIGESGGRVVGPSEANTIIVRDVAAPLPPSVATAVASRGVTATDVPSVYRLAGRQPPPLRASECPAAGAPPAPAGACPLDAAALLAWVDAREDYFNDDAEEIREESPDDGDTWGTNIATQAVGFKCGRIGRPGVFHSHADAGDVETCLALAAQLQDELDGKHLMSESDFPWLAFSAPVAVGEDPPKAITPEVIRQLFGGTLHPEVEITVQPLERYALEYLAEYPCEDAGEAEEDHYLTRMQEFFERKGLKGAAYVDVSGYGMCAVYPSLVVALTEAGSVVGVSALAVCT